jgi:Reverse transcriptase (RNA-dependent DNA polymerase)
MVIMLMAQMEAKIVDVQVAFLNGKFNVGEELYMEIPRGFENYYEGNVLLRLKKRIYGLKQAAAAFWRELLLA